MKWRRFWAIARKEFLHVLRDPRSLGMGIAMPMVLLLLFGYALTLDVDRVPLVVWDQSQSPASREFLSRLAASRYFAIRRQISNYRELEQAIDSGQALAGLVMPSDFARQVESGRTACAQLILDGSDSNTATIAAGYAEAVTRGYSEEIVLHTLRRAGARKPDPPLEVRLRAWFNDDMQSRNYLVPGLIAVLMMIVAALLTSLTVAREWERGTMEQLLSTPVKGAELILGKLLPYFTVGMLDVVLAVLLGEFLFAVPLRGSLALLFLMAGVFLLGALSMGLLISIVAKSQLLANQMAMLLTFVPAYLLSGLIFAIPNMPKPIQAVTYLIPARYFVSLLRSLYLKGVGLDILALEAALLAAFAVAVLALALAKFRKKLT
jgi:ABC-2 type transport system permease protein